MGSTCGNTSEGFLVRLVLRFTFWDTFTSFSALILESLTVQIISVIFISWSGSQDSRPPTPLDAFLGTACPPGFSDPS